MDRVYVHALANYGDRHEEREAELGIRQCRRSAAFFQRLTHKVVIVSHMQANFRDVVKVQTVPGDDIDGRLHVTVRRANTRPAFIKGATSQILPAEIPKDGIAVKSATKVGVHKAVFSLERPVDAGDTLLCHHGGQDCPLG